MDQHRKFSDCSVMSGDFFQIPKSPALAPTLQFNTDLALENQQFYKDIVVKNPQNNTQQIFTSRKIEANEFGEINISALIQQIISDITLFNNKENNNKNDYTFLYYDPVTLTYHDLQNIQEPFLVNPSKISAHGSIDISIRNMKPQGTRNRKKKQISVQTTKIETTTQKQEKEQEQFEMLNSDELFSFQNEEKEPENNKEIKEDDSFIPIELEQKEVKSALLPCISPLLPIQFSEKQEDLIQQEEEIMMDKQQDLSSESNQTNNNEFTQIQEFDFEFKQYGHLFEKMLEETTANENIKQISEQIQKEKQEKKSSENNNNNIQHSSQKKRKSRKNLQQQEQQQQQENNNNIDMNEYNTDWSKINIISQEEEAIQEKQIFEYFQKQAKQMTKKIQKNLIQNQQQNHHHNNSSYIPKKRQQQYREIQKLIQKDELLEKQQQQQKKPKKHKKNQQQAFQSDDEDEELARKIMLLQEKEEREEKMKEEGILGEEIFFQDDDNDLDDIDDEDLAQLLNESAEDTVEIEISIENNQEEEIIINKNNNNNKPALVL